MARMNIGFLDVKEISSDVLLELFVDYRADQKSITRGVFGYFYSPFLHSCLTLIPHTSEILEIIEKDKNEDKDTYEIRVRQNQRNNISSMLVIS